LAALYPVEVPGAPLAGRGARRLQIGSELIFLLVAFGAGLIARSLWIIPALGLISTIAYAAQNWRLWREISKAESKSLVIRAMISTFALQTALIAGLYLMGLGLWTVINNNGAILSFGINEFIGMGILLAIAVVSGTVAGWLDRRESKSVAEADEDIAE